MDEGPWYAIVGQDAKTKEQDRNHDLVQRNSKVLHAHHLNFELIN